jgi:hypothetical protein
LYDPCPFAALTQVVNQIKMVGPSIVFSAAPVASHSRTVLSIEADASSAPSSENTTELTQLV